LEGAVVEQRIAWNRNSEKLPMISHFVKVVEAVGGDQER
jgi:hypothetical protein